MLGEDSWKGRGSEERGNRAICKIPGSWRCSTAVLFVGGVGIFGALAGRSALVPVINVNATCFLFAFLLTCVGVVKLRLQKPDAPRPFRVPGGIVAAGAAAVVCLALLFPVTFYQPYVAAQGAFPIEWIFLMVWAFLGVLLWFFSRKVRGSISEQERRAIMLGKRDPDLQGARTDA